MTFFFSERNSLIGKFLIASIWVYIMLLHNSKELHNWKDDIVKSLNVHNELTFLNAHKRFPSIHLIYFSVLKGNPFPRWSQTRGRKTGSGSLHTFLLWDTPNSGFTVFITNLWYFESLPHFKAKRRVLWLFLCIWADRLKKTCPAEQTMT